MKATRTIAIARTTCRKVDGIMLTRSSHGNEWYIVEPPCPSRDKKKKDANVGKLNTENRTDSSRTFATRCQRVKNREGSSDEDRPRRRAYASRGSGVN